MSVDRTKVEVKPKQNDSNPGSGEMALWVKAICYESYKNLNSDLQETHGARV